MCSGFARISDFTLYSRFRQARTCTISMSLPFNHNNIHWRGATPPTSEDEADGRSNYQLRDDQPSTVSDANDRSPRLSSNDARYPVCNTTSDLATSRVILTPSGGEQTPQFNEISNQTRSRNRVTLTTRLQNQHNDSAVRIFQDKPTRQNSIGMTDSEGSSDSE